MSTWSLWNHLFISYLIMILLLIRPFSSEVHLLFTSSSVQQDDNPVLQVTCQVTNVDSAAETLVYLNCPILTNAICFTNCSAACHYVGPNICQKVQNLSNMLQKCEYFSYASDHVAVTYYLRRSDITASGDWYCTHRGQDSRSHRIQEWIPPPTTLSSSTTTITTTTTVLPSTKSSILITSTEAQREKEKVVNTALAETTKTLNRVISTSSSRDKPLVENTHKEQQTIQESSNLKGRTTVQTPILDTTLLTRKELVLVMLGLLSVSLLLNLVLCVRCVMVKIYIDDMFHKGNVSLCMERCLCLSGDSPIRKNTAQMDFSHLRVHPFHSTSTHPQQFQQMFLGTRRGSSVILAQPTPLHGVPFMSPSLPCTPMIPGMHSSTPTASLQGSTVTTIVPPASGGTNSPSLMELFGMNPTLYQSPGQQGRAIHQQRLRSPPQLFQSPASAWTPLYMDMDENGLTMSQHASGGQMMPHSAPTRQPSLGDSISNASSILEVQPRRSPNRAFLQTHGNSSNSMGNGMPNSVSPYASQCQPVYNFSSAGQQTMAQRQSSFTDSVHETCNPNQRGSLSQCDDASIQQRRSISREISIQNPSFTNKEEKEEQASEVPAPEAFQTCNFNGY